MCVLEAAPINYPDLHNLSIMAFVDRPAMVMAPPFQGMTYCIDEETRIIMFPLFYKWTQPFQSAASVANPCWDFNWLKEYTDDKILH